MKRVIVRRLLALAMACSAGAASGHGLVQDPPSRNWFCGAISKPDEVVNGVAEYPVCGDAFANAFHGGYQFMSVLTHDRGRAVVTPLPEHVCGFGSETFNGGATPWDSPIDWPTSTMRSGRQEFKWNIQWGPHFDDTEEFRYWITKPNFRFQVGRALSWDDFQATEFCALDYSDARPNANPNVIPLKSSAQFSTFCNVPPRRGRHVIYAEWGRNRFTFERFHGCIDVVFDGGTTPPPIDPVEAAISLRPDVDTVIGEDSITLDGSTSQGGNLDYLWSVSAPDATLYRIDDSNRAVTTLRLAAPSAAQSVTVSLLVSNGDETATVNRSFLHEPDAVSDWVDLGQLTSTPLFLKVGDSVSVRTVLDDGQDVFYPQAPLPITATTTAANVWPSILARAINDELDAPVAIGLLDDNDQVIPVADATENRIYSINGSRIASAFLQVDRTTDPEPEPTPVPVPDPSGDCNVTIRGGANPWWVGLDVATNAATVTLDFTATGLDLSNNVRLDAGVFAAMVAGQTITLTVPFWVSIDHPGYLGFNASNNPALANFTTPDCRTQ